MVKEYHIIMFIGKKSYTFISTFRRINLKLGVPQQIHKYSKIDGGIVNHQNSGMRCREFFMVVSALI